VERSATSGRAQGAGPISDRVGAIIRKAARVWRILATGAAFVTAGILSLALALVVIPLVRLGAGSGDRSDARAQYAMHLTFRFFVGMLVVTRVMRLHCHGAEKLREPGLLVVANHPTLIDALILMSFMPQADCVVKAGHRDNFWLKRAVAGAGYIPNRNGPQLVDECANRLRRGRSVLIFPEGTRSPKDDLGHFARGAAHIAMRSGCDLLPVTLRCDPATLHHGLSWWEVPERRFTVTLTVDAPLPIDGVSERARSQGRAARHVTALLREHFERRLEIVRA
jgi:1-acyl-sn-glycerol-3-phosphate acyltransferase